MRICVDMGHTPASPGAGGCFDELTEDRQLGQRVAEELARRGHNVINSTPPGWMAYPEEVNYRSEVANNSGVDLFLSIHFNALNGTAHGTEVLYQSWSDIAYFYAERMSAKVSEALGTFNRGPKARTGEIGVLRETKAPAILLETCFCDNEEDAKLWWACSWERIVNAICDSIDEGMEDDMTFEEMWFGQALNDERTEAGSTTPGNMTWGTYCNTRTIKEQENKNAATLGTINAKLEKLSAGGIDQNALAEAVSKKVMANLGPAIAKAVADEVASRMKA